MRMKTKAFVFAFLLIMLIGVANVTAVQPTQQYNKIFLSPFYNPSMSINTNTTYSVNVNPPDKISSVTSAIISFDVYITPTVTFTLWVNNKSCNNPNYIISTTFAGSGQSRITFDCSNIIKQAGNYTVTIRPTQANTGAISGWLDLTYMNNPSGDAQVHGTEYTFGQTAKIWLQLLNANKSYINEGICFIDIYTPSGSQYVERATMNNMIHDGIYYYDLLVPDIEGVYPVLALCYYEAGQTYNYASSYNVVRGSYISGSVSDLLVVDNQFLRFQEAPTNPVRNVSVELNFPSGTCANISELLLTGISVRVVAKFDSVVNDDITISIWNYTSSSWMVLPNKILEGNVWRDVSDSLITNNLTKSGFISGSNSLRLLFEDTNLTDGATSNLDLDLLSLSCDQLSNPQWQETRGSSELHINQPINVSVVSEQIWNYSNRTLTTGSGVVGGTEYSTTETRGRIVARILDGGGNPVINADCNLSIFYPNNVSVYLNTLMLGGGNISGGGQGVYYYDFNHSGIVGVHTYAIECVKGGQKFFLLGTYHVFDNNVTAIASGIWNYNGTVSTNILSQFVNSIWNFTGTIASNILTQISNTIWSAGNRNLTFYPNVTTQVVSVENVTLNITLNTSVVSVENITLNLTTQIVNVQNVTLNLTVLNQTVNVQNVTNNVTTQIINVNNVSVNPNDIAGSVWNYSNGRYTHGEIST